MQIKGKSSKAWERTLEIGGRWTRAETGAETRRGGIGRRPKAPHDLWREPRNGPDDHRAVPEAPNTCGNALGASSREAFVRSLQRNLGQRSARVSKAGKPGPGKRQTVGLA
eukprot:8436345-Pyramimonas_sp.AAC.1